MKTKQFLILLAFMPLFLSCKKDTDYRDGFEGTYTTEVAGMILLTDLELPLPMSDQLAITVMKSSSRMLTMNLEGQIIQVTVEEDGTLQIPSESGVMTQVIDDAGTTLSMDVTVSYTGTITDRMLQIKQTYSGTATITDKEGSYNSAVEGSLIYSGIK